MKKIITFFKDHQIPAAIIAGVFAIVCALIGYFAVIGHDSEIALLVSGMNQKPLQGVTLNITGPDNLTRTTNSEGKVDLRNLKKGVYKVTAKKDGYIDSSEVFDYHDKVVVMHMVSDKKSKTWQTFSCSGWSTWGGLEVISEDDISISISGDIQTAGYVSQHIDTQLKGKTIKIDVENSDRSSFSNKRMFKMTYNNSDITLKPNGTFNLINSEYIPAGDKSIEVKIPEDFDGKIGFVFYHAVLDNLKLKMAYR